MLIFLRTTGVLDDVSFMVIPESGPTSRTTPALPGRRLRTFWSSPKADFMLTMSFVSTAGLDIPSVSAQPGIHAIDATLI